MRVLEGMGEGTGGEGWGVLEGRGGGTGGEGWGYWRGGLGVLEGRVGGTGGEGQPMNIIVHSLHLELFTLFKYTADSW